MESALATANCLNEHLVSGLGWNQLARISNKSRSQTVGYNSRYRIYAGTRCLGQFAGWTADEAIKQAQRYHPKETITKAVYAGENKKES